MNEPRVYASCSSYVLGRSLGHKLAEQTITQAVQHGGTLQGHTIPGALTLARLAEKYEVTLRVDGGATCIGKSRSRHFHEACRSDCDVWLTVDDDVSASRETVHALVEAVTTAEEPRVCLAPCLLRESNVANVEWSPIFVMRELASRMKVRRASRGGFGLVAMNRLAMEAVQTHSPSFRDDDEVCKPAAFMDIYSRGRWLGEDVSFFERAAMGSVVVEALITGHTVHAGAPLNLAAIGET